MNEYDPSSPKVERNHDQRKCSYGYYIAHRRGVIEKIENNNSTDQHDPHRKGIGNVHGAIKKAGLNFISQVAMRAIFMHLGKIE